ncbi:MAG: Lon-like protease helical domain-containing protein, partial [Candidatus Polarisedimenticolia bacterium]
MRTIVEGRPLPENTALLAPLGPDELAWRCPSDWLQFKTTAEIKSFEDVTEQREAAGALRLALRIRARGYNVYVAGAPGTGRSSMVRRMLEVERENGPIPSDLLYVHNLQDPRAPRLLRLPPG